jgi:Pro-kumamolisin, activation domain
MGPNGLSLLHSNPLSMSGFILFFFAAASIFNGNVLAVLGDGADPSKRQQSRLVHEVVEDIVTVHSPHIDASLNPIVTDLVGGTVPRHDYLLGGRVSVSARLNSNAGDSALSPLHTVTVAIQQNNIPYLQQVLHDVSDPTSSKYGQHLSFEQVGALVANRQGTAAVSEWLHGQGIEVIRTSPYGEYITARAPVDAWEQALNTQLYYYHKTTSLPFESGQQGNLRSAPAPAPAPDASTSAPIIRAASYSLPAGISAHIRTILNLVSLPVPVSAGGKRVEAPNRGRASTEKGHFEASSLTGTAVTPATLRSVYGITGTGSNRATQCIYASIGQTINPTDLAVFQSYFGLPSNPLNKTISTALGTSSYCSATTAGFNNCGEASLDCEYITGLASSVPTTLWYDPSSTFMIDWISNVSASAAPPMVASISYSTYELFVTAAELAIFDAEAIKLGMDCL